MKLQEQMDGFKQSFVEQVPEEALETMARSGEKLLKGGHELWVFEYFIS